MQLPAVVVPKFDFIGMLKNIQRYRIANMMLVRFALSR